MRVIYTLYICIFLVGFYGFLMHGRKSEKVRRNQCIVSCLLIVLLIGLRSNEIGGDTMLYVDGYNEITSLSWSELFSIVTTTGFRNYDIGYVFFCKVIGTLFHSDVALLMGCASISIIPYAIWFYRDSPFPFFSFIILLGLPIFDVYFTALRQCCAIGVCILSMSEIEKRNFKKFLLFIILATSLHGASFIFALAYPAYWLKIRRKTRILTLFLVLLIFIAKRPILLTIQRLLGGLIFVSYYSIDNNGSINLFLVFIMLYIFTIIFGKETDQQNGLRNIFLLAVICQIFGNILMVASRTAYYFIPSITVLIPQIVSDYKIRNTKRVVYVVMFLSFLMFGIYMFGTSQLSKTSMYEFYWMANQ